MDFETKTRAVIETVVTVVGTAFKIAFAVVRWLKEL